jgi:hypothetical protein
MVICNLIVARLAEAIDELVVSAFEGGNAQTL